MSYGTTAISEQETPSKAEWSYRLVLCVLLLLYGFYAGALIWNSSFLFEGKRFFALFDDAFISMRYAHNLITGHGLVWNPGDRVEGITNPGWTAAMAACQYFVSSKWGAPLIIEIVSAFCLANTAVLAACLARRISGSSAAGLAAFTASAFFFPLNFFSIYGMETGALALLVTAAVLLWISDDQKRKFPWISYIVMGAALFVRIDAAVALLGLWIWGTASDGAYRRRHFIWGAGTLVLVLGAQTAWRLAYYGFPLPNTYYLKMTGFPLLQRIARGAYVAMVSLRHVLLPGIAAVALIAWFHRQQFSAPGILAKLMKNAATPIFVVVAAQVAYSIFVGGDAWEADIFMNRYLVVIAPVLFSGMAWMLVLAYAAAFGHGSDSATAAQPSSRANTPRRGIAGGILLGVLMTVWLNCPPNFGKCTRQAALLDKPLVVAMAESHAHLSMMLSSITAPEATIAIDAAGSLPYYLDRYFYDILGKSDTVIAHEKMHTFAASTDVWYKVFYPGHMKWDADYTAGKLKPDVIFMEWFAPYDSFLPFIKKSYIYLDRGLGAGIFVRKGSTRINWDRIPKEWLAGGQSAGQIAAVQ